MRRVVLILFLVAAAASAGWWAWRTNHPSEPSNELALYGNVDLRQVDLPFNNSERIASVLVQEGDHVKRGEVLAELDTSRLAPRWRKPRPRWPPSGKSSKGCTTAAVPRKSQKPGPTSRIGDGRRRNARRQYRRLKKLVRNRPAGRQPADVDNAKAAAEMAEASWRPTRKHSIWRSSARERKNGRERSSAEGVKRHSWPSFRSQLADAELARPRMPSSARG